MELWSALKKSDNFNTRNDLSSGVSVIRMHCSQTLTAGKSVDPMAAHAVTPYRQSRRIRSNGGQEPAWIAQRKSKRCSRLSRARSEPQGGIAFEVRRPGCGGLLIYSLPLPFDGQLSELFWDGIFFSESVGARRFTGRFRRGRHPGAIRNDCPGGQRGQR